MRTHEYQLSTTSGLIPASRLRTLLCDRADTDSARLVRAIDTLNAHKCRYSGEDHDVLSAAWAHLGWPK